MVVFSSVDGRKVPNGCGGQPWAGRRPRWRAGRGALPDRVGPEEPLAELCLGLGVGGLGRHGEAPGHEAGHLVEGGGVPHDLRGQRERLDARGLEGAPPGPIAVGVVLGVEGAAVVLDRKSVV